MARSFEELAAIYDGVSHPERLRVCFDTCHTHDAGYDIVHNFDSVIEEFDRILGKDQIAVFHINDSKNPCGAHKDRHANIGQGEIGFDALYDIVHHPDFADVPKILETPYLPDPDNPKKPCHLIKKKLLCFAEEQYDHFQIQCFLNVAEYLNFTEAANHLFCSPVFFKQKLSQTWRKSLV